MDTINILIRTLREARGITHKTMAERLYMARSTYSKLESGKTELNYRTLVNISKALEVPLTEIIKGDDDTSFKSISEELAMMMFHSEHQLSEKYYEMIPYNQLNSEHKLLLKQKGFDSQEAYEDTPLNGRIYKFGPKDLRRTMFENFGFDVLFRRDMILDEYWKEQWEKYNKERKKIKIWFDENGKTQHEDNNEIEIDEYDYFVVFWGELKMPDGAERSMQFAARDFPDNFADESEILNYIIDKTGAISGDIMCWTDSGYDPVSEIIKYSDL